MAAYLLARIAHILAGANWQRGGGKGPKPKPLKVPGGRQQRRSRKERGQDAARRLRNLGMIPGQTPQQRPLTPQEQALAAALEADRVKPDQQPPEQPIG